MTGLELLIAIAGVAATLLVVAGMILITPRGEVDLYEADRDGAVTSSHGSELSRADAPDPARRHASGSRPFQVPEAP